MNTGWRDVEGMSYLADGVSSCPEGFDLKRIERQAWPPQPLALVSGIRQSRLHPLPNDGPLKFGKGSQQVKQELPRSGGAVQLFVKGYKRHAEALELVQGHNQVLEATT